MPAPMAFSHQGRNLEVRAAPQPTQWVVRVFEGNRPVTNVTYSIDYLTQLDAQMQGLTLASVDTLMQLARDDVTSGRAQLLP
jgi:hypothetical protein